MKEYFFLTTLCKPAGVTNVYKVEIEILLVERSKRIIKVIPCSFDHIVSGKVASSYLHAQMWITGVCIYNSVDSATNDLGVIELKHMQGVWMIA